MSQTVTINLPEPVYDRIKQRAAQTHRSVEDELVDIATAVTPEDEVLTADQVNAVVALRLLDDKTLWQAARTHLSARSVARIARLHNKRRDTGLNEAEVIELASLVEDYENSILIRSEAMDILMERGYDISKLTHKKKTP